MQQFVLAQVATLHQRIEVHFGLYAILGEHHVAPVCICGQTARGVNRIHDGQRNIGNRLLTRFADFAGDVRFLRSERRDADIDLRAFND
ncbi:Uncharacterised protein [Shigella sonnei]|nr:Uncharacterised protein [Shigella sonnei]